MQYVRYVLFDFFDTLVGYTSNPGRLHEMYQPLAGLLSNDDLALFHESWNTAFDHLVTSARRTHNEFTMYELARKAGSLFDKQRLSVDTLEKVAEAYMDWWESGVQVYEDTLEMIPVLGRKYTLGIISNTFHKPTVPTVLSKFGLTEHFNCIVTSVGIGRRKPSADIFQAALAQLNAQPVECCFVGDNYEEDIVGARAAGMKAIQICRKDQQVGTIVSLYQLQGMLEESINVQ